MALDDLIKKNEPFSFNTYAENPQPCRMWTEVGHMANDGYHSPSLNMEFKNGTRYEFNDRPSYDNFRSQFPNQHRTLNDFGNRDINKLDFNW
ncbi:MAG: hypothetical protein N4A49_06100 [Marinifilaceae bacterium]|jgi:hypothetical protein|nr:hypothetical protein [Marinifilaceae bacterium]